MDIIYLTFIFHALTFIISLPFSFLYISFFSQNLLNFGKQRLQCIYIYICRNDQGQYHMHISGWAYYIIPYPYPNQYQVWQAFRVINVCLYMCAVTFLSIFLYCFVIYTLKFLHYLCILIDNNFIIN